MPDLTENEVKLIRLMDKFDTMQKHCDTLTKTITNSIAWKKDLKILHNDIATLRDYIDKQSEQFTWLTRLLFGVMMSAGVGMVVFLIQNQKG